VLRRVDERKVGVACYVGFDLGYFVFVCELNHLVLSLFERFALICSFCAFDDRGASLHLPIN